MKNINNYRLVLYLLFILCLISLNIDANKNNIRIIQPKNSETIDRFKEFVSKFKLLSLPFIANTSCYEPDSTISIHLDMDTDSVFIGYVGPSATIGMLPDTSTFY